MSSNTYAYELGSNLYINLTNKCTCNCDFCIRNGKDGIMGTDLYLEKEPTATQVIKYIEQNFDLHTYHEIVFCGYGEPTMAIDVLLDVARFLKEKNATVRINTNGHGNKYNDRNIAKEFQGIIDVVSISLNASNAIEYDKICKSRYKNAAFDYMLDFARECKKYVPKVVFTIVDVVSEDEIEKCKKIAEDVGIPLRIRTYVDDYESQANSQ